MRLADYGCYGYGLSVGNDEFIRLRLGIIWCRSLVCGGVMGYYGGCFTVAVVCGGIVVIVMVVLHCCGKWWWFCTMW